MHKMHNEPHTADGPRTDGVTLHWAAQYDVLSSLLGLGVNRPNSRMVIELANVRPGDRVLDVGCGSGNLTLTAKIFAGPGAVYGLDASPEMIDVARRKASQARADVTFELGLIERLPFPDANFDVVVSRLVIHHLPDDLKRKAFTEILRVLKPGGQLLVADFNPPANPLLGHLALALVGHGMMRNDVTRIPPMFSEAGFVDVASGPTRSAFLAYIRGKKPAG